jgi:anti-sigma B factor antagonist
LLQASGMFGSAAIRVFGVRKRVTKDKVATAARYEMKQTAGFRVNTEQIDDRTAVISVAGEVDLYTAPELKRELVSAIDQGARKIVVDLSEATFIDSTTLGVLLSGVKRLRPLDGELAVVCTDRNIRKIFEITLLDRVFSIHEDRAEALGEAERAS